MTGIGVLGGGAVCEAITAGCGCGGAEAEADAWVAGTAAGTGVGAGGGGGVGTDGAGNPTSGIPGYGAVLSNATFSVNTGSTLNIYVGQAGSNVYTSASGSTTTNAVCGDGSIGGYGGYAYNVSGAYGANGGAAGGGGAATALICSGVAVIVCGGGGGAGNGGAQGVVSEGFRQPVTVHVRSSQDALTTHDF